MGDCVTGVGLKRCRGAGNPAWAMMEHMTHETVRINCEHSFWQGPWSGA